MNDSSHRNPLPPSKQMQPVFPEGNRSISRDKFIENNSYQTDQVGLFFFFFFGRKRLWSCFSEVYAAVSLVA